MSGYVKYDWASNSFLVTLLAISHLQYLCIADLLPNPKGRNVRVEPETVSKVKDMMWKKFLLYFVLSAAFSFPFVMFAQLSRELCLMLKK